MNSSQKKNLSVKNQKFSYSFRGKLWKNRGPGGWYFITLPKSVSNKIRKTHHVSEEGWGRLKTCATIGTTKWNTAIWYDTKAKSYLIPIKALIRKKESIVEGVMVKVELEFELDKWLLDIIF